MKHPVLLAAALGLLAPAAAQAQHWQAPPPTPWPATPYDQNAVPYGQRPVPYGQRPVPYGQRPVPYGQHPVPYGQPAEPYDPYFQPWFQREVPAREAPQVLRRRGNTPLHVVPPEYGVVLVYDEGRLVAQIDRPMSVPLPSGRWYRVVAQRGPETLWSGAVEATGEAITLRWPRDPYAQQQGYAGVLQGHELRALLAAMDTQRDDLGRLDLIRDHARWRAFTVAQADRILPRFRWERWRVQALAEIQPRLVDAQRGDRLLRHFEYKGARRDAAAILRGEPLPRGYR